MSGWSPPSPPRELVAGLAAAVVVVVLYALFIQNAVLWALLLGTLVSFGYVLWRLLVALEAIADGVHRIADERE